MAGSMSFDAGEGAKGAASCAVTICSRSGINAGFCATSIRIDSAAGAWRMKGTWPVGIVVVEAIVPLTARTTASRTVPASRNLTSFFAG